MNSAPDSGLVHLRSAYSVAETTARLERLLSQKGITLFCRVDHSGEAEKASMHMPPTQLLIFGSPKGGTPLMQAAPTLAIDLPLKALIWQDEAEKVWLSYNAPEYLQHRHNFPVTLLKNIAGVTALFEEITR